MLKFCGFDLELTVDRVLRRDGDQVSVFSAFDGDGEHWLICGGSADGAWICAPASDRAVEAVASGRAAATDAIRHSATGWVEVVRLVDGHAVPEHRVSCAQIPTLPEFTPLTV